MKIKYDRRVMRIILTTAVVVSVPTLAGMICGVFFDDIVSTFCDVMMVTSVITFCPMAGLWLAYLDAWLYLRELIKAGYEVPDDRRKYNCVLENLPREREDYCIVDGRDRDSVISACITAACALCFAVVVIKYYVGWWRWLPGVSLPGICLCIVAVFWVAGAVVYYRQSDNRRYRGRLEPVDDRKIRTYLFKKIMTVLLAGFVSVIFDLAMFSAAGYMAKAQVEADVEKVRYEVAGISDVSRDGQDGTYQPGEIDTDKLGIDFRMKDGHLEWQSEHGQMKLTYVYTWKYGKTERSIIR